jgi:YspA, cpYpsA-related SLOG family
MIGLVCIIIKIKIMIKLAIVGTREFTNYEEFNIHMSNYLQKINCTPSDINQIISGGAAGADSLAERYATEHHIDILIFKPNWERFGKAAGVLRNTNIIENSTHVLAFPSKIMTTNNKGLLESISRGTNDSIRKAIKLNKLLEVCYI